LKARNQSQSKIQTKIWTELWMTQFRNKK
jgi:hypothetical protein